MWRPPQGAGISHHRARDPNVQGYFPPVRSHPCFTPGAKPRWLRCLRWRRQCLTALAVPPNPALAFFLHCSARRIAEGPRRAAVLTETTDHADAARYGCLRGRQGMNVRTDGPTVEQFDRLLDDQGVVNCLMALAQALRRVND